MIDWLDDSDSDAAEPLDADIEQTVAGFEAELAANQGEGEPRDGPLRPWREGDSATRGSRFEGWCNENVMDGRVERLRVETGSNAGLELSAAQRRLSDDYWVGENAIWEFKCGYEKGHIDRGQLNDYWKMMDESGVRAVRGGGALDTRIESVNYLFDSRAGALNNRELIEDTGSERVYVWYLDDNHEMQLLS